MVRFLVRTNGILFIVVILFWASSGLAAPLHYTADGDSLSTGDGDARPRIGLVLGGGGARGAAHIGVLRALDEMQIPVDYVCGTSMGAIVATLFSLGLTPDEIEDRFLSIDWNELLTDLPDRRRRTFRRKEDDTAFFLPVEFGFREGSVVTNRGILAGQKLSFAFPIPEIYTAGHRGFDHLAYPLRTVATDLNTGEMVVMDHGNLVQAVRASMSIPGLFPPVKWEGRELVDGGVVRNLPVDVVRDMGAEVVIAVDVGTLPEEATEVELGSIYGVLSQTLAIQARNSVLRQMQDADVIIQVQLEGISFKDFKRVADTIPLGEADTRAKQDLLDRYALPHEAYAAHLASHRLPTAQPHQIDQILFRNDTQTSDRFIQRNVHQQVGQPLDLNGLENDLAAIYDLGVAERVDFSVIEADSQTVLTVSADPKPYAPHILRLGLSYSGGQMNKSDVRARIRHTWLEINGLGGEWRTDGQYGRIFGFKSEFYQPLTWSRTPFIALTGWWRRGNYDWFENLHDAGDFHVNELAGSAEIGSRISHWGEVRLGLRRNQISTTATTTSRPAEFDGATGGITGRIAWDTLDQPIFPRRGMAASIDYFSARPGLGSDLTYEKLEGEATGAVSIGASTFRLSAKGGTDLNSGMPDFDLFSLGGLDRLSGYRERQLNGRVYGIASARWYHRIKDSPSLFPTTWYVGLGFEAGNAWADQDSASLDNLHYCINISLMVNTYLGPLVLAYGRAEDGNDAGYVTIGSPFGIFD